MHLWRTYGGARPEGVEGGGSPPEAGEIFKNFQRKSIKITIFGKFLIIFNGNFAIFSKNIENLLEFCGKL